MNKKKTRLIVLSCNLLPYEVCAKHWDYGENTTVYN